MGWTVRWIQFPGSKLPAQRRRPDLSVLKIPETSNSGNFLAATSFNINSVQFGVQASMLTCSLAGSIHTPPILDNPNPGPLSQPSDLASTRFTRPRVSVRNVFNLAAKWQGHFNVQGSDEIGYNNSILAGLLPSNFSTNRGVVNGSGDLVFSTSRIAGMAALGIDNTQDQLRLLPV